MTGSDDAAEASHSSEASMTTTPPVPWPPGGGGYDNQMSSWLSSHSFVPVTTSNSSPGPVSTTTLIPSATFPISSILPTPNANTGEQHHGIGIGAVAGIAVGVLILAAAGICWIIWRCCACCGRKRRRETREPHSEVEQHLDTNMLLRGGNRTLSATASPAAASPAAASPASTTISMAAHSVARPPSLDPNAPPPSYDAIRHDAIVPAHAHHRIGGQGQGEDDEFNVVADGKMPLSEIPFEDVDIEALYRFESNSAISSINASRDFAQNHRRGGGNTIGHTNS
ncbi:hypothetical protein BP5796_01576 [Coleophoma crateriformis]|uniref:Mid2 domain-containing protein n=1 Tax=Coleophoma crateriformis TaxID=565419 RepID=A0A3D8T0T1_9HELO|nr:hypothetical protein BP5796_01576 [Coleophoma crateriformis]